VRILHIVAGLPPGGGIAESVPALCRHLRQLGHEVTLATLDGALSEAAQAAEAAGVRLMRFAPSFPRALYFSWSMLRGLSSLVREADVVHVHSNWTFPVWWGCRYAVRAHKPLAMSPQGCLAPARLRRSAWKKRAAGFFFDRRYLCASSLIHATCEAERQEIEAYVQGRRVPVPPVAVVPNGLEVDAWRGNGGRAVVDAYCPASRGKRVVLFLGRIDPIKGLDLLIGAWRSAARDYPDWHLIIAGPDERGYASVVKAEIENANVAASVTLCGPVYGEKKRALVSAADLFVLPTYNENFGIAVAEALAAGVPVITTKGAPWSELLGSGESELSAISRGSGVGEGRQGGAVRDAFTGMVNVPKLNTPNPLNALPPTANGRCGWWVEIGVEPLVDALREAMSLTDDERHAMGRNGFALVERKCHWETVAQQMIRIYRGLIPEGRTGQA